MNKALDEVRAGKSRRMASEGRTPLLKKSRWLLVLPIYKIVNYLGWPNAAATHGGALIIAWALLFIMIYCLLLAIDHWWRRKPT